MRWLVDGYNVILSDHRLSKILRNDNETGRQEFLSEIARSPQFSKEEVVVVFDGRFAPSFSRETPRLVSRFTAGGETADELIKLEIARSTRRRSLRVVTDDRSILSYARECGAGTVSSGNFLAAVRERTAIRERTDGLNMEKPEPPGRPDPELLKMFTGRKK